MPSLGGQRRIYKEWALRLRPGWTQVDVYRDSDLRKMTLAGCGEGLHRQPAVVRIASRWCAVHLNVDRLAI
jgi:hypothetical protein